MTNASENSYRLETMELHIADHQAQLLHLQRFYTTGQPSKEELTVSGRDMNDANTFALINRLNACDWLTMFGSSSSAVQAFSVFHDCFNGALDSTIPIKRASAKNSRNFGIPKEIKEMRNTLDALATIAISTKNPVHYEQYTLYRTKYKDTVESSVRNNYLKQIEMAENKQKKIWNIINENTKVKPVSSRATTVTAQSLNDYFIKKEPPTTVGLNINEHLDRMKIDTRESIYMKPVTGAELVSVIAQIKSKRTADHYGMTTRLLKNIVNELLEPLVYIINKGLSEGVFPEEWKISKVVPIFKKGDANDVKNYRPISILPAMSKVFEKVILTRLTDFFEKNHFLNTAQHGYRQGKSTTTGILNVIEDILSAMDTKQQVNLTCCDLTKAFDTVGHGILLDKLCYYGIRGTAHKLMQSYLMDRKQYVSHNGEMSTMEVIHQGVPQGSILGPFLYILYVNDLPSNIKVGNIFLYADDTSILVKGKTENELISSRNNAISGMEEWFTKNDLKLNTQKTQDLTFRTRGGNKDNTVRFLGLHIDESLSWNQHINVTAKKLAAALYSMRRIKQISTNHAALMTYFANFHSVVSYGVMFWGMATEASRIFRLQKKAVRILANLKQRETCRNAFRELKILTLPSQYILTTVMYVHQNRLKHLSNGDTHTYETRHRHDLQVPLHRIKKTQNYTDYWGVHLYNKVPVHIKNLNTTRFKKTVKNLLNEHVCYSVDEFLNIERL